LDVLNDQHVFVGFLPLSITPRFQVPPGLLLPGKQYFFRATSVDLDLTEGLPGSRPVENDGVEYVSFSPAGAAAPQAVRTPPTPITQQPVCANAIGPSDPAKTKKGLVFMVHGWKSDVNAWALALESDIRLRIHELQSAGRIDPSVQWFTCAYDWRFLAETVLPITAYAYTDSLGTTVGNAIATFEFDYIHFIAHSAGSNLVDKAARVIQDSAKKKPEVINITFLDAYAPLNSKSTYGSIADWAEHYVDKRDLAGILASTNMDLQSAFNFDITALDDRRPACQDIICDHAWPYVWYGDSVTHSPFFTYGWHTTVESGATSPRFGTPGFGRGGSCVLSESSFEECFQTPFSSRPASGTPITTYTQVAVANFTEWTPVQQRSILSPTGIVDLGTPGVLRLSVGSPVWISIPFETSQPFEALRFAYRFSGNAGQLSVFLGEDLVHVASAEQTRSGQLNISPFIGQSPGTAGSFWLSFRLDNFDGPPVSVEISDIKFGALDIARTENQAPISVPGTARVVRLNSLVQLDGSASTDPDNGPSPLSFLWQQTGGPASVLNSSTSATPTFTPKAPGEFVFSLTVSDGELASRAKTVVITVPKLGDIDQNGVIDTNDLHAVIGALGMPATGPNDLKDLDGDGRITGRDVAMLAKLLEPRAPGGQ
jgi:hypothetical protein